jgi:hypothetical protein
MVPAGICTASSPNKPVLTFMLNKETAEVIVRMGEAKFWNGRLLQDALFKRHVGRPVAGSSK